MDAETRGELDKLHERITRLRERVTNIEAQQPHITAMLLRIEKNVERLNGHIVKAVWVILALFLTAVWKLIANGTIPNI